MDYSIQIAAVNPDLLYQQMANAGYPGISIGTDPNAVPPVLPVTVTVHGLPNTLPVPLYTATQPEIDAYLASVATQQAAITAVTAVVQAHDPTKLTVGQQQALTVSAAKSHVINQLIPQLAAKSSYYLALTPQSPEIVNASVLTTLCNDFGTTLAAISAWITATAS